MSRRRYPAGICDVVRQLVLDAMGAWEALPENAKKSLSIEILLYGLAAQKCTTSPFPRDLVSDLREGIVRAVVEAGGAPAPREGDRPQPPVRSALGRHRPNGRLRGKVVP